MLGLITANPLLTAAVFLTAAVLVVLLWRAGTVPVLLFVTGMLWLQPATKVLHADLLNEPVADMTLRAATIDEAVLLSLLAVVCIAVGMRLAMGRPESDVMDRLTEDARSLSATKLAGLTLVVWVGSSLAGRYAPPGAIQLVVAASNLESALIFALACTVFLRRSGYLPLAVVVAAEVLVGFTGFFSGFKDVLFLLFIAAITVRPHVSFDRMPRLLAGVAVILAFGLVWTAIKSDLRDYLNAGTGQQVVLRGPTERLQGLADQLESLDSEDLVMATEALARRLAYVDFFAIVLDRVPTVVPHADGAILMEAIHHVVTPRILFPDKPSTGSDTEMTNRYTGLELASAKQGTSINLGWPAEAYIDFGRILMVLPMLGIGLVAGLTYRLLARPDGPSPILAYGLAVGALIGLPNAGTLLKLTGALIANLLVLGTISVVFLPVIARFLRTPADE